MKICRCFPCTGRKASPSHCLFTINSFSLLSKASGEKYTSEVFEAGGYQWTLSIYPTGNEKRDGRDHISIYLNLIVRDSSLFPVSWEVNAIVNLFVYDSLRDEYFSTQDGSIRRFHELQREWGIAKFIDLASFKDPSNGYLRDDCCTFGAEIFIVKATYKGYCLSMIPAPPPLSYRWEFSNFSKAYLEKYESEPFLAGDYKWWKFDNFSKANLEKYESETFLAGDYKWKLIFYPNGNVEGLGNSISLFLSVDVSSIPPNTKLYVHCILRTKDQISDQHVESEWPALFHEGVTLVTDKGGLDGFEFEPI
ncbi:uncharacterized protein LOC114746603 [Neltuma alba]|uniref:uncharacterized protein LOC114746603 n=1 Tax=Neltuma alba TaxID=207710 RepID=UPI0010A4E554|nr:uncharacterized protein LOC114746603 [Prosopis alba]